MRRAHLASLMVIGVAACSDGTRSVVKSVVNRDNMRGCVDQLGEISAGMDAMDPAGVIRRVAGLLGTTQTTVTPKPSSGPTFGVMEDPGDRFDGSGICTTSSCTYIDYNSNSPMVYRLAFNGSVMRSGDAVTFAIDYHKGGKTGSMTWSLDGTIASTSTRIDGALHGHVTAMEPSTEASVTWDVSVDFTDVALDAQRCPTAGSMRVVLGYADHPTADADNAPRSSSYDVEGAVAFGPSCDELVIVE
jgi:hypothetical protein